MEQMENGMKSHLGVSPATLYWYKDSVLVKSMAIVIGPTPPGTGVMCPATCFALSKSTSPTKRYPRLRLLSGTLVEQV